ncbi:aminoacyl-tRNA hydrolase [Brucepastera parasyntrophica]|uniref:aminoacyl-tRNA hydrolase n=1 Tax=Brucepastera parasyntrophica TaxID=2880008 RepID=UPI00210E39BA|nr:aminoacyl-tRNA hydrolase [Brucepastera parasyntrophica]ULQ60965.1 aminoacyl-tRNA hydrolase [Brucepastera parasyntrophica]
MISLVVFLGNYGKKFAGNRHNAGWLFADSLDMFVGTVWQKKFKGEYCTLAIRGETEENRQVFFLKPETYMNLSGTSIRELAVFYKIKPEEMLVVHDELELPPGTVSLKWSGGLGGHNGLRSAKEELGTADFWRLRIGIGRPGNPDVAGYVLSDFSDDERILLSQIFPPLGELMENILARGPESFLKEWSKKKLV